MMWRLIGYGSHPGDPHGLLTVWPQWEHLTHHVWPLTEIPDAPYGTLKMRVLPYRGKPVALPDGTEVSHGSTICELHCDNPVVLDLVRRGTVNPYRAAREDLRALARWAADAREAQEVLAFHGFTMLGPAAQRMGFTVRACEHGVRERLNRVFMTGLLLIYTRDGLTRLDKGRTLNSYPQEVWMSRGQLVDRYARPRHFRSIAPAIRSQIA